MQYSFGGKARARKRGREIERNRENIIAPLSLFGNTINDNFKYCGLCSTGRPYTSRIEKAKYNTHGKYIEI